MNKIVLYKVPFNYGDIKQPYFMSDSSRDSFFELCDHKQVNYDNVNIKIDFNYELTIKINIDIVEAEDYNFAILHYNGKNLYCHIIDAEQISIGFSRLMLRRFILAERTNYFQYFKDFMINKATFSDLKYGKNTKMFLPDYFRYKKTLTKANIKIRPAKLFNPNNLIYQHCYMFPFYQVFLNVKGAPDLIGHEAGSSIFGEHSQNLLMLIPYYEGTDLDTSTKPNMLMRTRTGKYRGFNYGGNSGGDITDFLNEYSPYITSVSLSYLPIWYTNVSDATIEDIFTDETYKYSGAAWICPFFGTTFKRYLAFNAFIISATYVQTPIEEELRRDTYFIEFTGDNTELLNKHNYYFYSRENSIKVETPQMYSNNTVSYTIEFYFIPTFDGTEMLFKIYPNSTEESLAEGSGNAEKIILPLLDTASFSIDSEAVFISENKYYDALTRNSKDFKGGKGTLNVIENAGVGITQLGIGAAAGDIGQISMGVGNIIRGITETGKTAIEVEHYTEERRLNALNEKSKPSETAVAGSAGVRLEEQRGEIYFIKEEPITEDLAFFYKQLHNFGVKTSLVRDVIDIEEFSYNGEFFIKAIAERNNLTLNTREYNEMLKYLNKGSIYFIV